MTPNDKLIDRIKKLLTKTEGNGCSKEEAEAALAMASRLMAEHELDMADIAIEDKPDMVDEDIETFSRWDFEAQKTYEIISHFCFVKPWLHVGLVNGKKRKTLKFFGRPEGVEAAREMWHGLTAAYDRLFAYYRAVNKAPASHRRSFIEGVANGFYSKMKAERESMQAERDDISGSSGGTALALTNIKGQIDDAFRAANPNTKTERASFSSRSDHDARRAGFEAGQKLSLSKGIGAGSRKSLA